MPSRWIEFVREFAVKNNTSYGCALSRPEVVTEYHKKYNTAKYQKMRKAGIMSESLEEALPSESQVKAPINLQVKKKLKQKPSDSVREAFKMSSEDILSKRTINQPEVMEITPVKKKRTKKVKAAEPFEEALPSESQVKAPINLQIKKKAKRVDRRSAAQKVFDIRGVTDIIKSYVPLTFTESEKEDILDDYKNWFDFYYGLLNIFEIDMMTFKNKKQETSLKKSANQALDLIGVAKSLIQDRLDFLVKKNKLKEINWDDWNYDYGELTYEDWYQQLDISGDSAAGEDTGDNITNIFNKAVTRYDDVMEKMDITQYEARVIINKRLQKRDAGFKLKVPKTQEEIANVKAEAKEKAKETKARNKNKKDMTIEELEEELKTQINKHIELTKSKEFDKKGIQDLQKRYKKLVKERLQFKNSPTYESLKDLLEVMRLSHNEAIIKYNEARKQK